MGVNIQITDGKNASTIIGSGSSRHIPIVAAGQIDGWREQSLVVRGGSSFKEQPFAVGSGDCLFDTGSLFCFVGAEDPDTQDNVVMVLWGFPANPQADISGSGQLNSPPSAGSLVDGPVTWLITLVA
jgi:hypothetical protein